MSRRVFERVEELRGHKYITLKSGRRLTYWNAIDAVQTALTDTYRAYSRALKLAGTNNDPALAAYELERFDSRVSELEEYTGALRVEIDRRLGVKSQRERIALLRNTSGRSPEEAAAFARKADELERRLGADHA